VLPSWIEPSDDPLLSALSAAYSTSFTRRAGEEKEPSAVQIPRQRRGGMTMTQYLQLTAFSRILHWTMAVLILAMLFIGMVSSLSDYH